MFDIFFQIGAWAGFVFFCICGIYGGFMIFQAVSLSVTIIYARWKWRKIRNSSDSPINALITAGLMEKEFENDEEEKMPATTPPNTTKNTNTNDNQQSRTTGNKAGKVPTPRKV